MDAPTNAGRPATFASDPVDLDRLKSEIVAFVEERVRASGTDGVVVALSGGVNSTVATMLAVEALGPGRVLGLLMPSYKRTQAETFTAELVAEGLGIDYRTIQLLPFVHLFRELSVPDRHPPDGLRATTNAIDRMRTACAYYAANVLNYLVLGVANRTEWLLGTVTKHGVRGGDLLPLGDCYWTEVLNLADHIGIPSGVLDAGDGLGNRAAVLSDDVPTATLDAVLSKLVDDDEGINQSAIDLGLDVEVVRQYAELHVASRHKRRPPRTPATGGHDRYGRFHEIELRFF